MKSYSIVAIAIMLAGSTSAYKNNCKGSSRSPNGSDCQSALRNINPGGTYTDQVEFSVGECYVKYATNGSGPQPINGGDISRVAQNIIDSCDRHVGSFGTGNCDKCHVTVNFRA